MSAAQLTIVLTSADLANPGSYSVAVTNSASGNTSTAAVNFTVTASNNPVPTISSLSPNSLAAGAAAQTLTINGTGFLSTSTVTFNSVAHAASFLNASQLTISLTTSDLATAGSYPVVVANPAPGGGSSPAVNFTVTASNPVPAISSLSPSSSAAGAAAQTLTINGTGFLNSSTATFNTIAHTATYVSAGQLTISLTTADLATAGSYPVVVTNPAPGGGSSPFVNFSVTASNPAPTISSLFPNSLTTGAAAQTLTINGTGFLSTSTVTFNGVAHTPSFVNASQLTISLTSTDLATAGSYAVVVTNPAPGGGSSPAVNFTVTASNNPVPTITSLSPSSLSSGAAAQTLTINGTGFLTTSTVTFNGAGHAATYVGASQLTISLTTADLATAGSYPVVVTNPAPGGGSSAAFNFTVSASNPVPTISSFSPSSLAAGAAAQTLTIHGTGFLTASTVTFNGIGHTATYVSAAQLTISLTTADLATAGSFPVVVTNPAPGGGSSAAFNFTVSADNPAPTITSLSPPSLAAGASSQTLTINGTGFLASSTVTFNGAAHAATYISATQLTIFLVTADLATAGSYPVVVTNPAPGGGASATVNFTVNANNPVPSLSSITPSSATAGAGDTDISVTGGGFVRSSVVQFNSQSLSTTFTSATSLTAVIPSALLATAGAAVISVATPAPGGGTSTNAQFTINPAAPTGVLALMASPAYVGSSSGPWQLTVSAADSSGNPVSNLQVSLQATAGTLDASNGSTDSNGVFNTTITPPTTYSGGPVTVSASGGGQTALVNIVFIEASPALQQQAAANLAARRSHSGAMSVGLGPEDSSTNNGSGAVKQFIFSTSSSTNPFLADSTNQQNAICDSNAQLGSTVSVDCQSLFSTRQIQVNPMNSSEALCSKAGTFIGVGSCGAATAIAVACLSPETGLGAVICTGFVSTGVEDSLISNCAGYIAGVVAQHMAGSNLYKNAAGQVLITIVGDIQDANNVDNPVGEASGLIGVACNAVDAANAGFGTITVTPKTPTTVGLNGTVKFQADSAANWSVMANSSATNKFGTITSSSDGIDATYTAPATFPEFCGFGSGFCGVTLRAASTANQDTYTDFIVTLVNAQTVPSPANINFAPNQLSVGFSGIQAAGKTALVKKDSSGTVTSVQLAINGSGFLGSSTVTVNGAERTSTYISPSQLEITINQSDVGSPGQLSIVVSNPGAGSSSADLPILSAQTPLPNVPQLQSPGSGTSPGFPVTSTTPQLQWTGTGATQFDLGISQAPCSTNSLVYEDASVDGGTNVLQVPDGYLQNGTSYCWYARAYSSVGWSDWSSPLYFTLNTGAVASVELQAPGTDSDMGFEVSSTTPAMSWTGSGATKYELAISKDPYGASHIVYDAIIAGTATSQALPAGILLDGVKYRWNMRADDDAGWSPWTSDFYFGVNAGSNGVPPVPHPTSPGTSTDTGSQVTTTTPTMSWTGANTTEYELAISQSPYGASNVVYDTLISGTASSQQVPSGILQNGVKYRWNMQASNLAGLSSWSQRLYFGVNAAVTTLTVNGFSSSYSSSSTPYQPTISLTGSGFNGVTQISWSCTNPSGGSCTGSPYVWTPSNWSGKFSVSDNSSASVSPKLLAAGDVSGTYNWSVTFSGAGGQSVTKYFSVINTAVTTLTVNGFSSSYSSSSTPYQPTISLTGSGFNGVTQISWSCTNPSGGSCTGSPYVWTPSNWSGKFSVSDDSSASVSPKLLAAGDVSGTYNWSVTFSGAGGQSVTKYFSVINTAVTTLTVNDYPYASSTPDTADPRAFYVQQHGRLVGDCERNWTGSEA